MNGENELIQNGIVSVKRDSNNIKVELPLLRDYLSRKSKYDITIHNVLAIYKGILKHHPSITYECDIETLSAVDFRLLDLLYQIFPAIFKKYPTNVVSRVTLNIFFIFQIIKSFLYLYYDRDELDEIIVLK